MTDTAESLPRTTIGQLVYRTAPRFSFARLVADLDGALAGSGARRLSWDHDDVAILDLGGSRIALCLAEELGRDRASAVTVAAGFGPAPGDTCLAGRQAALARLIVERIAARFPAAETVWSESGEIATPDLFDRLNDALAERLDREAAERPRVLPRPAVTPLRRKRLPEPQEVGRMLARIDATLAARRAGLPDPSPEEAAAQPGEPANREPDLPRADRATLDSVRSALYASEPETDAPRPSPAMRLAAHAMDATLLVVALPVGAAMMTYSLARGGDLRLSARMLALGGIWAGALGAAGGLAGVVPAI